MQEKNRRNLAKIVIIFFGILIPSFIFFGLFKGPIYAATSDTVNLQGKIVRNDAGYEGLNVTAGNPACVVTGSGNDTCDFRVRYYDASTAGNLLLTEQFSNIEIGQYVGVFNISLGSDPAPVAGVYTSLSSLIQGEDDVYVEVSFDPSGLSTYTEVFSRMPLEATAYAVRAKYADNATGATAMSWSGLQDPTADLTLQHSTRKTLFNWATGTGTNDLFSLTSDASATGTGALLNVQTGTGASLMPFRVRAGSVEGLMVDNQGRVGVGTTNPQTALDVNGIIKSGNSSFAGELRSYQNDSIYISVKTDTTANKSGIYRSNTSSFPFYYDTVKGDSVMDAVYAGAANTFMIGGSEKMRIANSGNVGIGTTFPQQKLTLSSGSNYATEMASPIGVSTTATTGGTLASGTYYYKVVATDGSGYTVGSSAASCTVDGTTTNACQVSWSSVTGAASYRVYGRVSTQDQYWAATGTSYTDTGTVGTAGSVPTSTTAYVNKVASSGNSWLLGGNVGIGTTAPSYTLDVSGGTGIVARFSGRVIGADAVNSNELVTKSQLDSIGGSITTYWQRTSPNLSPLNANDSVLPNISGDLGAAGLRWGTIYGNTGSFSTLEGNSTLTLQPSADGQDAVRIVDKTTLTSILSVDTLNSMVGIGTESPDSALHVAGQVKITGGTPGTNRVLTSDLDGLASWSDLSSIGGVVTSIIGTANQITASAPTGEVTLSIPTDFRAPGTVNAVSGIYTGDAAGTQRIDASGNLVNIGDITFTAAGVTLDTDSLSPNILNLASGDSFNLVSGSLQVGGVEVITSGRLVRAANGSATTPSFSFSADDNTGMYSGGTDILKFATAGADRVTILADGKVGIGRTDPGEILHIRKNVAGGIGPVILLENSGSSADPGISAGIVMGRSTTRNVRIRSYAIGGYATSPAILFEVQPDAGGFEEKMRINYNGNVGIGTTSPTSLFSVGATSQFQVDSSGDIVGIKGLSYTWPTAHTTNGYLKNNGTGGLSWAEVNAVQATGTPYGSATEGPLAFWTGPSTIAAPTPYGLYWDDINQFLGIGTNTPSAPLDIAGGTGGSLIKNSSGDITIEPAQNLIISQGNVGMGTPNPLAKLHVKGNQILLKNEANADLGIILDSGSTATYRDVITFKDRGTDIFALEKTATNAFQLYDYAGTGVSRILVGAGGNSGISMRTTGTGDFSFINDTTTRVTIKSDGWVGVGVTDPVSKLHTYGTVSAPSVTANNQINTVQAGSVQLATGVLNVSPWSIWLQTKHSDNTGATFPLVLNPVGGNVGIGNTTPSSLLELGDYGWITLNAFQSTAGINFFEAGTKSSTAIQYGGTIYYDGSDDTFNIATRENSTTVSGITIERTSGEVGIGTTTPAQKLDVNGFVKSEGSGFLASTSAHATASSYIVFSQVKFNVGNDYDSTNGRYTAPINGLYQLCWGGIENPNSAVSRSYLHINGANYYSNATQLRLDGGSDAYDAGSKCVTVYMSASDYAQIYMGESGLYTGYTYFTGHLIVGQ